VPICESVLKLRPLRMRAPPISAVTGCRPVPEKHTAISAKFDLVRRKGQPKRTTPREMRLRESFKNFLEIEFPAVERRKRTWIPTSVHDWRRGQNRDRHKKKKKKKKKKTKKKKPTSVLSGPDAVGEGLPTQKNGAPFRASRMLFQRRNRRCLAAYCLCVATHLPSWDPDRTRRFPRKRRHSLKWLKWFLPCGQHHAHRSSPSRSICIPVGPAVFTISAHVSPEALPGIGQTFQRGSLQSPDFDPAQRGRFDSEVGQGCLAVADRENRS